MGKNFYRSVIFLPSVVSLVVGTMLFVWILNPISGPAAKLMGLFGLTAPVWSTTQGLVIVVISIMTSWKIFGYNGKLTITLIAYPPRTDRDRAG